MFETVIALKINSLLLKSQTDDKMISICQITNIRGDLLKPNVENFGLSGFGNLAVPVKFSSKYILVINKVEAPS